MSGLPALFEYWNEGLWHGFLVFLRVTPIVALLPGFGEQYVPVRVKLALALVATVAIAPMINAADVEAFGLVNLVRFALAETFAGLIFGLGVRLLLMTLQTAGTIAAQSTSLSQILGASSEPMPAIGQLLAVAGTALAMQAGLHVKFLGLTIITYDLIPPGEFFSPSQVSSWALANVSAAFSLAFQLGGAFVLVSLLYNLALGAINRAMPQLMVAFVGAPAITAAGLALLALLTPFLLTIWLEALDGFLANPSGVAR